MEVEEPWCGGVSILVKVNGRLDGEGYFGILKNALIHSHAVNAQ